MQRLVQIEHPKHGRRAAVVRGDDLCLIRGYRSTYSLVWPAIHSATSFSKLVEECLSSESLEYDPIYQGTSRWCLLPPFDHPSEPSKCSLSGTGLTHKASAQSRQDMHHEDSGTEQLTDSMRMYQWGLEGGRPSPGEIGVQPEWFYKGQGQILRAHGESLTVPSYALDGGEEPEIAGLYVIDSEGTPWRVGMTTGNEFSDHTMEQMNYLYLAPSKLRTGAIGPELIIDPQFEDISGTVRIERAGETIWSKSIKTGQKHMCHSLANLEHHHFKYRAHREPGDVHIHFYGADAFSFGSDVKLCDGDWMEITWKGFGRPLRNPLRLAGGEPDLVAVKKLF